MKEAFTRDINKIRQDMMDLWKITFHDSSRYIKLVFDSYFNPDNAFTVYDGEKLVAALLGVEYQFQTANEYSIIDTFKGMYLCGLATLPEYRRQGIMANLMDKAERSAKYRGFDITFLIPADEHLREYYQKKGYITASYKISQTSKIDNVSNYSKMHIYTFKDLFDQGKIDFIGEIAQWCCDREKEYKRITTILHTKKDMITIMEENENSFFITDQSFDPKYPILAKVRAVVFPTTSNEKTGICKIVGLFTKENEEKISGDVSSILIPEEIKDNIMALYPGQDIEFNLPYIETTLVNERNISPYGMVKPLFITERDEEKMNKIYKIYLMLD